MLLERIFHHNYSKKSTLEHRYGSDPNAVSTWDANRITACVCDSYDFSFEPGNRGDVPDWIGHDCSLRTCPHGNPPWNRDASHEEKRVTCT